MIIVSILCLDPFLEQELLILTKALKEGPLHLGPLESLLPETMSKQFHHSIDLALSFKC